MRKSLEEKMLRKIEKKIEEKTFASKTKIKSLGKNIL